MTVLNFIIKNIILIIKLLSALKLTKWFNLLYQEIRLFVFCRIKIILFFDGHFIHHQKKYIMKNSRLSNLRKYKNIIVTDDTGF